MDGYVANTSFDWFDYLARQAKWDEVNFWNPSAYFAFRGAVGSPVFFRLKAPHSAIAGFGYFSRYFRLPEWLAWDAYEQANGASTLTSLTNTLQKIREKNGINNSEELQQIGCIILASPHFFPKEHWVRQPSDWGRQNLRYKQYDLSVGEGLRVWLECQERVGAPLLVREEPASHYGMPRLIAPRLGQGTFRLAVTEAYGRACAVTGEHSLPALEASHIKPFAQAGPHSVPNGLLLRSDLHRLFDRGYLTVGQDYRLQVSSRLRDHFSNGKSYYPLDGTKLILPRHRQERPDPEYLSWHRAEVYRG